MYKNILRYLILPALLISGCGSTKSVRIKKYFDTAFFERQFVGFTLYDPQSGKTLYNYQGGKYFTPASNTKIFTLYTALHLLPDSIPALHYNTDGDTLYIEGTGNPVFLHPYFGEKAALDFLANREEPIALYTDNFYDDKFGPGWSWGDYAYYYSPERNAFPVYGNVLTAYRDGGKTKIVPESFRNNIRKKDKQHRPRSLTENTFYLPENLKDTLEIPFVTSPERVRELLSDTLKKDISLTHTPLPVYKKTLYSIPSDSVYRRMMHVSDNFLAEQLLLMSAQAVSDSLNARNAIDRALDSLLPDIPQKPRWVDGSGLSRYNLFTPESMVYILNRLYRELPRERLFTLFPAGGQSGTLKNSYKSENDIPYLYAKSGTLSNNHNLSGYILTKSGKILVFSYMNNHYMHPTGEVRQQMETLFRHIRDRY
ncbi:D-alanyl-D-alanine carboxypeptidase/D-alanyl-D-alanine-endopeptidase [Sinomicrobium weinanense]|uniref:D-alanyl-D-alanine carboxypeptidase n=1 Tax=Sinomicrobium weinanense TaxID=2842200 RepID=A0A926JPZ4_9FLAO|nr:D-alanyl-D-alanine carboxypeptidase [Sinomicrobium weinanense]MBC9795183.1 D-alanyl-D-alanine carboxypeptidase [Sinomicrobium weinanense]MBU3121960.1 D-alanyl-D-alanine carboxypeptidase [Sinomicrobium weinanense]